MRLEVRRCGDDVVFRALAPAVYALRGALGAGRELGAAAEAAMTVEADFDLAASLRDVLNEGIIVNLMLPRRE